MRDHQVNAFLVGEAFMRADDPGSGTGTIIRVTDYKSQLRRTYYRRPYRLSQYCLDRSLNHFVAKKQHKLLRYIESRLIFLLHIVALGTISQPSHFERSKQRDVLHRNRVGEMAPPFQL